MPQTNLMKLFSMSFVIGNLSKTDTIGNQNFIRNSEVFLTQGLPVGVACVIGLLSTTSLRLQSFPLLYTGRKCYAEASAMSNRADLMSSC